MVLWAVLWTCVESVRGDAFVSRTVVWLYKRCIIADELEGAGDAGAKGDKVLGPCGIILRPTWGSACSIWCVKLRPLEQLAAVVVRKATNGEKCDGEVHARQACKKQPYIF